MVGSLAAARPAPPWPAPRPGAFPRAGRAAGGAGAPHPRRHRRLGGLGRGPLRSRAARGPRWAPSSPPASPGAPRPGGERPRGRAGRVAGRLPPLGRGHRRRARSGCGSSCRGGVARRSLAGRPARDAAPPRRPASPGRLRAGLLPLLRLHRHLHLPALPARGPPVPALHRRHRLGLPGVRGGHRGVAAGRAALGAGGSGADHARRARHLGGGGGGDALWFTGGPGERAARARGGNVHRPGAWPLLRERRPPGRPREAPARSTWPSTTWVERWAPGCPGWPGNDGAGTAWPARAFWRSAPRRLRCRSSAGRSARPARLREPDAPTRCRRRAGCRAGARSRRAGAGPRERPRRWPGTERRIVAVRTVPSSRLSGMAPQRITSDGPFPWNSMARSASRSPGSCGLIEVLVPPFTISARFVALHVPRSALVADGVHEDGRFCAVQQRDDVHPGGSGVEDLGVPVEVPAGLQGSRDERAEAVVAVQDVSDSQHHHARHAGQTTAPRPGWGRQQEEATHDNKSLMRRVVVEIRRGEVRRVRRVRALLRRGRHPSGEWQGPAGGRRALRRPGRLPGGVSPGRHPRARAGGRAIRRGGGGAPPGQRHPLATPGTSRSVRAPTFTFRGAAGPGRRGGRLPRVAEHGKSARRAGPLPPRPRPVRRPRASSPTGPRQLALVLRAHPGWPAPISCSPPTASPSPSSTGTCGRAPGARGGT